MNADRKMAAQIERGKRIRVTFPRTETAALALFIPPRFDRRSSAFIGVYRRLICLALQRS
jgi:hypothetical protein